MHKSKKETNRRRRFTCFEVFNPRVPLIVDTEDGAEAKLSEALQKKNLCNILHANSYANVSYIILGKPIDRTRCFAFTHFLKLFRYDKMPQCR